MQDSVWLSHLPQFPLTLTVAGEGTVIARSGDVSLPCESGCQSLLLDNGTIVTVVALPAAGWRGASWSGGCTGTTPGCAVAMSAAETASVTFVRSPLRIAVKLTGKGRITSSPGGIACSKACAHSFAAGGSIRLRAIAARGWRFAGWSGACAGRGACVLTEAATAGARFVRR